MGNTRALKRQAYIKEFKKECKVDIAMSGVAIAVSIAMSFGAAALSVVVIAKAVLDIALTLEKLDRRADQVESKLQENILALNKLYLERLAAKKSGGGQKASKTAQAGKTAIALGSISEKLTDEHAIVTFTNKAGTTAKITAAVASLAKVTYQVAATLV